MARARAGKAATFFWSSTTAAIPSHHPREQTTPHPDALDPRKTSLSPSASVELLGYDGSLHQTTASMSFGGQTPTIIVLKEGELPHRPPRGLVAPLAAHQADRDLLSPSGTDTSQGKGQIISNINACLAVQGTVKPTLGPYGGDLLMVDENGRQTITNDGATVMKVRTTPAPAPAHGMNGGIGSLTAAAPRHRPPRRPNPRRHCPVPRRRGR